MNAPKVDSSYTAICIVWAVSVALSFVVGMYGGRTSVLIHQEAVSEKSRDPTLIDLVLNVPGAACRETERKIVTGGGLVSNGNFNTHGATVEPKSQQEVLERVVLECTRSLGYTVLEGGRKLNGVKW